MFHKAIMISGLAALALAAKIPAARAQSSALSVVLPDLSVATTAADAGDFDKYYYFHRVGTDFATALADIEQCDALSSGLTPGIGNPQIVGGAAVVGLVGAIASGNRRALRRVNMRRCMFFKGYGRHGLAKPVWQQFNFEEGGSPLSEAQRTPYIQAQAKAASGPQPARKDLGE